VFSYLPVDVDSEKLHHFREGGIVGNPDLVDDAKERLARFASGFLHAGRDRIVAFETYFDALSVATMKLAAPFFTYRPTRYRTWDGKTGSAHELGVSLYALSEDLNGIDVGSLVCGPGRPDTGFLGDLPPAMKPAIKPAGEISAAVLEEIALRLRHITVPAYDAETYLVWSRSTA
jgi:hypothetical protein